MKQLTETQKRYIGRNLFSEPNYDYVTSPVAWLTDSQWADWCEGGNAYDAADRKVRRRLGAVLYRECDEAARLADAVALCAKYDGRKG